MPKPPWLRVRIADGHDFNRVRALVHGQQLHTVCESALCPNIHECWGVLKTATFLILGDICTRGCRFCAVTTGCPGPVDPDEPRRIAESIRTMGLRHAVITMVTRDDLPDGGATVVAETVTAVQTAAMGCTVEVLVSDLMADPEAVQTVVAARPAINGHNIETVQRLTPYVRSRSTYARSLRYLAMIKEIDPCATTKSSLMLGLGETRREILAALDDLRRAGVDIVNLGQYLQPTPSHLTVQRYWTPDEFADLKAEALTRGFAHCESGPMVRSSYHAAVQPSPAARVTETTC